MNKKYEIKIVLTLSDKEASSNEFKEFINSIKSGEMQKEMLDAKNRVKIADCKITILQVK